MAKKSKKEVLNKHDYKRLKALDQDTRDRLAVFAMRTLEAMEDEEDWGADLMDVVTSDAMELNLAKDDGGGMFKAAYKKG